MKSYKNGVFGPDFESCDIVTFDLGDAELQFCLPIDSQYDAPFLESMENLKKWKSASDPMRFSEADWDYWSKDTGGEWRVGSISFSMRLFNLDSVDLESFLGSAPYSLLSKDELSRLAIDYMRKIAIKDAEPINPEVNIDDLLRRCFVATEQEDLIVSKLDLLPWYTNRMKRIDFGNWWSETLIPVSNRGAILVRMDFVCLTEDERPLLFTDSEAQDFGEMLRKEFFSYFKITYSLEIQHKIKQLANG